ncbi:MAG TPA: hypothetical protein VGK15_01625 [Candidatus Limnocylindria bacterium]
MLAVSVGCAAVLLAACTAASAPVPPDASPVMGPQTLRVLVTRAGTGAPVVGAHVCASTARGASDCADAAKDGTVTLHGAPGTYFVKVSGPAEQRYADAQRVTDLLTGGAALWVELVALQRISGVVRDESAARVAGAEACAHPASDDAPICARSGTDGGYAIDVKSGIYRLDVTGPGGGKLVSQWARGRAFLEEADILDARNTDVPDVDVTLVRGVVLRGTVRLAGAVVENAQVCLRTLAAPLPWECERTDKSGRYAALREPGDYFVWVVPPANVRAVAQWYDRSLTGVGSSALSLRGDRTLDVSLPTGPQVRGVVRTTNGEAVANALVCIDTPFTTSRICRETDGSGRYAITTRPETYIINVIPPEHGGLIAEYWSGKRTWSDADEIDLRGSDVTLDLVLRRGVTVTGAVKNARGIPVAGATLNFADDRGVAAATDTDSAGRFEAVMLPGRFGLDVAPPFVGNLLGKTLSLDVRASMEIEITLDDVAP